MPEDLSQAIFDRHKARELVIVVNPLSKLLTGEVLLSHDGQGQMLVVFVSSLPHLDERHVFGQVQTGLGSLAHIELEEGVCKEDSPDVFLSMVDVRSLQSQDE